MYIAKYLPTIRNSYVQISPKKIEKKNWEHQWFPKLREISFKAQMSADGRTDWLTDSQSSLSSFYNIDMEYLQHDFMLTWTAFEPFILWCDPASQNHQKVDRYGFLV